ncbi:hypothetical protein G7Y89_g974 [Cudoniella acicularis]|uniref:Uncharacterized protein n=1 Tax=Cudoniella acicularis TaxID=354080 RepID=A0A8H4W7V2_9HELO|nr:hypothetical protein G7Y89_g974 [Cudoniella acicularis]
MPSPWWPFDMYGENPGWKPAGPNGTWLYPKVSGDQVSTPDVVNGKRSVQLLSDELVPQQEDHSLLARLPFSLPHIVVPTMRNATLPNNGTLPFAPAEPSLGKLGNPHKYSGRDLSQSLGLSASDAGQAMDLFLIVLVVLFMVGSVAYEILRCAERRQAKKEKKAIDLEKKVAMAEENLKPVLGNDRV